MANCDFCEKEMLKAKGCLHRDYLIDGKKAPALPHIDRYGEGNRCGDCNCKEGELHHMGCDMEVCPGCGGQFISCDCEISDRVIVYPVGRSK